MHRLLGRNKHTASLLPSISPLPVCKLPISWGCIKSISYSSKAIVFKVSLLNFCIAMWSAICPSGLHPGLGELPIFLIYLLPSLLGMGFSNKVKLLILTDSLALLELSDWPISEWGGRKWAEWKEPPALTPQTPTVLAWSSALFINNCFSVGWVILHFCPVF